MGEIFALWNQSKFITWEILVKFMQWLKKPTITATIKFDRLHLFGHVQRMEENRVPKKVVYMNLEATRLRDRLRNRWQDEVREESAEGKGI
jgi:hypothetical protein